MIFQVVVDAGEVGNGQGGPDLAVVLRAVAGELDGGMVAGGFADGLAKVSWGPAVGPTMTRFVVVASAGEATEPVVIGPIDDEHVALDTKRQLADRGWPAAVHLITPLASLDETLSDDTRIDLSEPSRPRRVHQQHLDADADHAAVPESASGDGVADNCGACGLAVTSDGRRHGFDA